MSEKKPPGSRIITRTISHGAGYLFNDSRAAHEGVEEADILTCPHCQRTINLQAWRKDHSKGGTHNEMGGWCRRCEAPVCTACTVRMMKHGCEPFMKQVDKALEDKYRREQNAKTIGI